MQEAFARLSTTPPATATMRPVKLITRILLLTIALLMVPILVLVNIESGQTIRGSKHKYDQAREELQRTEQRLRTVEQKLIRLTSNPQSVEDEIRRQLRMIKPDEQLFLVE